MWLYGLKVAALGIGIVFIALIALMYLIKAQSYLLDLFTKKEKSIIEVPNDKNPEVTKNKDEEDPEELVAVISAAIAALGHQVAIKKITRIQGSSGANWSQANRLDAMNTRRI
ncbi:sodium pump decarboxylases, gamma subunit [Desulfonispora thiosulfatigenes DSM 11270]|uniref:Sodium pump decarboxylases, gamma subunit n=1 Tax=Desulfonispora thiosulfatigenes DSM 11270 TaxID=656914 RepID=A0A1W1VJT8_DESTI|nr:OadG family protein [Desulfonispora thiosulfatigenes]SMB93490.1 sodium pump decarboxylases, gamma subunit [Desulfonispora thiosulfatigenes DSM 11270]